MKRISEKTIGKFSHIFFMAIFILIFAVMLVNRYNKVPYLNIANNDYRIKRVEINHTETSTVGGKRHMTWTLILPKKIPDGSSIVFCSRDMNIKVYNGNSLIYSLPENKSALSGTSGQVWNFVSIPDEAKSMYIEAQYQSRLADFYTPEFLIGHESTIYHYLLSRSIPEFLLAFAVIVFGILMFLSSFIDNYGESDGQIKVGHISLFLGLSSLLGGICMFLSTDASSLIFSNHIGVNFLAFECIALFPIVFTLYVKHFYKLKDESGWKYLVFIGFLNAFVVNILQLTGVLFFRNSAFLTIIVVLLVCLFFIWATYKRKKCSKEEGKITTLNLAGSFFLIVGIATMIISYFIRSSSFMIIPTICFIIYISCLWITFIREMKKRRIESEKTMFYRNMASMDMQTGTYNRNAYEELCRGILSGHTAVVSFDLNYLKHVNDSYGHDVGDRYIKWAADLIRECFEKYGKIYRVGGDEFVAIMESVDSAEVENAVKDFKIKQDKAEKEKPCFYIAVGYAFYDKRNDSSIDTSRTRADEMLYRDKEESKRGEHRFFVAR